MGKGGRRERVQEGANHTASDRIQKSKEAESRTRARADTGGKEEPREDVKAQGQLRIKEALGCGVSAGPARTARNEERTKHPTSNLQRERQLGFNRRKMR